MPTYDSNSQCKTRFDIPNRVWQTCLSVRDQFYKLFDLGCDVRWLDVVRQFVSKAI
jgi:hypothetical protein